MVLPALALVAVATLLAPVLSADAQIGVRALVVAPAVLAAPRLAAAVGGRRDRTGALVAGTIAVSAVTNLAGGAPSAALSSALVPFFVGAGLAAAFPMLPDAVRVALRRVQELAYVALGVAAVAVGAPFVDPAAALAALALLVTGGLVALAVATVAGVDRASAIAGAGMRDPAVATAIALAAGGPPAAAVPLAYGALVLVAGAAAAARLRARAARPTIAR